MSAKGQFGEPLHTEEVPDGWGEMVFEADGRCAAFDHAQIARFVACVNALDGLDPEALPALIEALKLYLIDSSTRAKVHLESALAAFGVRR